MDAKEEGNSTTTTATTTTATKPTQPKLPRKRKRSFFLLTSCFCGSAADPEASQKPSGDVGSKKNKRKFSRFSWFSWSPFKKKKKKKKKKKEEEKSIPYVKASARQQLKAKSTKTRSITQVNVNVNASQQQPPILLTNSSRILEPIQSETRSSQPGSTGRFEQEAGLWVMLMTLALIVFFGRVTAVVALCTFFYLIPFLRVPASNDGAAAAAASGEVDVDSEGYKKRIVLGGLLERDSRRHSRVYVTS
ncbi:uncharacterized protein [Typha angustifolia]|uniref:uncharacterized protein n=1 Tax=Typha angustifolia TaxID=59011 RepID=UPI003C2E2BE9